MQFYRSPFGLAEERELGCSALNNSRKISHNEENPTLQQLIDIWFMFILINSNNIFRQCYSSNTTQNTNYNTRRRIDSCYSPIPFFY